MKKIISVLLLVALASPAAFAQDQKAKVRGNKKEMKSKHEVRSDSGDHVKMKVKEKGDRPANMDVGIECDVEKLNLSESQRSQVAAINQDYRTRREALKNENLTKEEMRKRWDALHQQQLDAIKAVLNEDQRKQLNSHADEKRKMKKGDYKYKEKKEHDKH
jgi:hypothetical protein